MVQVKSSAARVWLVMLTVALGGAACATTVLDGNDGGAAAADGASGDGPGRGDAGPSEASAAEDAAVDGATPRDAADAEVLVDCGAPGMQIFTSVLGPYCPFQASGAFGNCAVGEHCCEYAEEAGVASTCSAGATACGVEIATGFDWRCDESNDCPSGQVCCFGGAITPHVRCAGQYSASPSTHGTACRIGACAAGETRTCGSQADCAPGATCTGMRLRGKHFGFCKP